MTPEEGAVLEAAERLIGSFATGTFTDLERAFAMVRLSRKPWKYDPNSINILGPDGWSIKVDCGSQLGDAFRKRICALLNADEEAKRGKP